MGFRAFKLRTYYYTYIRARRDDNDEKCENKHSDKCQCLELVCCV